VIQEASVYPNPLMEREVWRDLGGVWEFAFDDDSMWERPSQVVFDREILVPFPPESRRSGIHDTAFHATVWYRRRLNVSHDETSGGSKRVLLHFGAVDYASKVWVDGHLVAEHVGGHTPYVVDITSFVREGEDLDLVVRAEDDPSDLEQPRGKQDWLRESHGIWYPRTTGIWQPVWLEFVPETRIERLTWTPDFAAWGIGLRASIAGTAPTALSLRVRLELDGEVLACDNYRIENERVSRRIDLPDPGLDEARSRLLWSPEHPTLIDATVELLDGDRVLDRVESYTAMRSVGTDGHRFTLNGRPYFLRMTLDQGYWPDTVMASTDEQLRLDVELTKALGFNGVRKHQKVENPRWLYWCDRLGLLVWEEMPSHYGFSPQAVQRLTTEWMEIIERDASHPCIMAWVVFNESWGVSDLASSETQQHYVHALYHLTKSLDPSRLVIGNDGWENLVGDFIGIHDYAAEPSRLRDRYGSAEAVRATVERPWGRRLTVGKCIVDGKPVVLSEFGGVMFSALPGGWGYGQVSTEDAFLERYQTLLEVVHEAGGIGGFCYTQLADTFQEANGLLTAERRPKADPELIARATRGDSPRRTVAEDQS
jgi:hypothetical protein